MFVMSCTIIGICLFIVGSSGNGLCILIFLRKKFRYRLITPYFITLLCSDSIYLFFRLIKLTYYTQTLFKIDKQRSCSNSSISRIYQRATQTWPQTLVPLVHSETYIHFSLILMSIMSVQRMLFIVRSLKLLVVPTNYKLIHKHRWTFPIILSAFCIAYTFEFAGLTLFCSKSINRDATYQWFVHMTQHMDNTTDILKNSMIDKPNEYACVSAAINSIQNSTKTKFEQSDTCTKEELINILSQYFDHHQKFIVNLIQKIIFNQTGQHISRNEIRRKYHFHECLFPQDSNFFHRHYEFLYDRKFSFNRHTFLLVFGKVIPSIITITSNIISVYRVRELNNLTPTQILPCRRRSDDTRRILIVITIECLFAIGNSWFIDIISSLVYCKQKLSASDDCPGYLTQIYDILIVFDMFNSVSNIILHCLCGKHFRNELKKMFLSFKKSFRDIWCCYIQINCNKYPKQSNCTQKSMGNHDFINHNTIHFPCDQSKFYQNKCCDCRWYINRQPLLKTQPYLVTNPNANQKVQNPSYTVHYRSLTQQTYLTRRTTANSMRLYYPRQSTVTSSKNRTDSFSHR